MVRAFLLSAAAIALFPLLYAFLVVTWHKAAEPVSVAVVMNGTLPPESPLTITCLTRSGGESEVPRQADTSEGTSTDRHRWAVDGSNLYGLRLHCSPDLVGQIRRLTVSIGTQQFAFSGQELLTRWRHDRNGVEARSPGSATLVLQCPPDVAGKRSHLPRFAGIINWRGDRNLFPSTALICVWVLLVLTVAGFRRPLISIWGLAVGAMRRHRSIGVPIGVLVLLAAAIGPSLAWASSPPKVAAGLALLLGACCGTGYLVLRWTFDSFTYRQRLALCGGVGLCLLVPLQFSAGLLGPVALTVVEVASLIAGACGLVLLATDWQRTPDVERRVPTLTLAVTTAILLMFCVPSAYEMSVRPDGSLLVLYEDASYHAALVTGAESSARVEHPLLPSMEIHYHYFLHFAAGRLARHLGLSTTDALFRSVRPSVLLIIMLTLATFPVLALGNAAGQRTSVSWLGPVVACGLPSMRLLGGNILAGRLEVPTWGWDFCTEMFVSIGGLGLCAMVPLIACLLARCNSAPKPSGAILLGLLVGSMVGFNIPAFGISLAALCLVSLASRRQALVMGLSCVIAAAWGGHLAWHVIGMAGDTVGTRAATHLSLAACLHGVRSIALNLSPMLHVKLLLAAAALIGARRSAYTLFLLAVMVGSIAVRVVGEIESSFMTYAYMLVAMGATLLAVAGCARLASRAMEPAVRAGIQYAGGAVVVMLCACAAMRLDGHRGQVGCALGVVLVLSLMTVVARLSNGTALVGSRIQPRWPYALWSCVVILGVISNTQFPWFYTHKSRVEPGIVASLQAVASWTPPTAVLAGLDLPLQHDGGMDAETFSLVRWFLYPALAQRPVITEAYSPDLEYGWLTQPAFAASSAAIASLRQGCSETDARAVINAYGITHVLAPKGFYVRWMGADWLRPVPLPGALTMYEVANRQ
jgi:hypothetical protein